LALTLDEVIAWTRAAFPHNDGLVYGDPPASATSDVVAAFNVASGSTRSQVTWVPEEAAYKLGVGLNGLAAAMRAEGRSDEARATFQAAYWALSSIHDRESQPEHFRKAISFAYGNLRSLGVDAPSSADALPFPEGPYLELSELLSLALASDQSADGVEAPQPGASPVSEFSPSDGDGRTAEDANSPESPATARHMIALLAPRWAEARLDAPPQFDALRAQFESQLGKSGILARDLGKILAADRDAIVAAFPEGIPANRDNLQEAARAVRRFAFQAGDDKIERRQRWLISSLLNFALWHLPTGLATNEPQVQIDLMGYVGAILMDHRYFDADRDLLLDCAESQVRVASSMTPVVLSRFDYLREWLLTATGTYLLLAGPDPSSPADSYYDERIQSGTAPKGRGLSRADRFDWPELLLGQWQGRDEAADGACHAMAGLSGWDVARATWMIDRIFEPSDDERRDLDRSYWTDRVAALLARVDRVRVATNPWGTSEESAQRGSMITSDHAGRFTIPDPVVRAAVAQGLGVADAVTVHGRLFEDRRVPTYLLTSRFGPFAILKVDYADKVLREVENFGEYAKRLHQSHRPSDCDAHRMDMYLGENGAPLRAIQTSYVFEEKEQPLTLGAWFRVDVATGARAAEITEGFFLGALRPWLAHVRRDRIDLRAEYPVIRPAPAPGKQSPGNWADTELTRLEEAGGTEALGVTLGRDNRTWPPLDPSAWMGSMAAGLDGLINPLWFAAEVAEIGQGDLREVVDSLEIGLRDFDTLLCLCHGDLHADNVLCTHAIQGRPHAVLIDFEAAHEGHICKDAARLEASMLCQVFEPDDGYAEVGSWFAGSVTREHVFDAAAAGSAETAKRCTSVVSRLRQIVRDCGQGHWPVREDEYLLALFGQLLPMARYSTLSTSQRQFALVCSAVVASTLTARWEASIAERAQ
jgi:hypothetical protein